MHLLERVPSRLQLLLGALATFWLNFYIVRDVFHLPHSTRMNSMQGFWAAMARLADTQWFNPGWWRYADAGAPFEHLYAPFTPALVAVWSKLGSIEPSQAMLCVTAFYYIVGPLTLYVFAAWLTRSAATATAIGFCYSLLSPASLLIPDAQFGLKQLFSDRRLYLTGIWDDTPHMGALAILPILWIFLIRALQDGRRSDIVITVLLMSLEAVASAFGPVLIIVSGLCLVFTLGREHWFRSLLTTIAMGVAAYLIACPFLPPSLISSIQENAIHHGESGWTTSAFTAISLIILLWVVVWQKLSLWSGDWRIHFAVYFALLTTSIPALWFCLDRNFVPQPSRYRMEMDLAWALLLVLMGRALWRRMPRNIASATALVLVSLGAEQIVHHRRYAKEVFAPIDMATTVDYQAARFIEASLPAGGRIFAPGSMATWFNVFSNREQFAGSSWSTAYNQVHQIGLKFIYSGDGPGSPQAERGILWLKAYGVQAIIVPGRASPEAWHPFNRDDKFEGLLTPIWKQQDTTIYQVPLRSLSLAHIVPRGAVVRRRLHRGGDTGEIERFVDALENPELPLATWRWNGANGASSTAEIAAGEVMQIQVSYHPGWHARVNGIGVPLFQDGLGLMWLQSPAAGRIQVELTYDGGWEMTVCRFASFTVSLLLGLYSLLGFPSRPWGGYLKRRSLWWEAK